MKYINKIGMIVVASGMLAATSCSDFSDYNTVPVDQNVSSASQNMMETIKGQEGLKDFAAIIEKAGYQNFMSNPQNFTLWAPLDGSYNAAEVLAMDSAGIVDKFIRQHMTQYSYPVSGNVDKRVITLNDKHHDFTNTMFDELPILKANIPSSNGLMHIIDGRSPYYPNISQYLYEVEENLKEKKDTNEFIGYLHKYDIVSIDTKNSVPGPLVNGKRTYLDTAWVRSNPVAKRILRAEIENEDSSYTLLVPTSNVWKSTVEKMSPLYTYINNFPYMDEDKLASNTTAIASLTAATAKGDKNYNFNTITEQQFSDSLVAYQIIRNLMYSNNDTYNEALLTGSVDASGKIDTLRTTNNSKLSNVREILAACSEKTFMSNGYTRTLNDFCFKPYQTYNRIITVQRPIRTLGLKTGANYKHETVNKDTIVGKRDTLFSLLPEYIKYQLLKDEHFFSYISADEAILSNQTARPEFAFKLDNLLKQKYHLFVVIAPSQLKNPSRTPVTDGLYLRFDWAYTGADAKQYIYRLNVPGAKKSTDDIKLRSDVFNVVELIIDVPISYYGLDYGLEAGYSSPAPILFMSHTKTFTLPSYRTKYEREFNVAAIYCVPESELEYFKSLKLTDESK